MDVRVRASRRCLILVTEMLRKRLLTCLSFLCRVSQDSLSEQSRRAETPPHGDAVTALKYASAKITIPFKIRHIQEKKVFIQENSGLLTTKVLTGLSAADLRERGSAEGQRLANTLKMM